MNFLFIITDQQRYDTVAAGGFPFMKTPTLDRLMREGCTFTHAFSPSPLSIPARYCLLTGTSARHHGFYQNTPQPIADPSLPALPQIFADHGWRTAAIGKCHFQPISERHGFQELYLLEGDRQTSAYHRYLLEKGYSDLRSLEGVSRSGLYLIPQTALVAEKDLPAHWVAHQAIEWLDTHANFQDEKKEKKKPFFLHLGFIEPHPPWAITDSENALYDHADLPARIPPSRQAPYPAETSRWYGDDDSPALQYATRQAYCASVSRLDAALERVLQKLESLGKLDDTAIVFTTDHGEMLGDNGLWLKTLPYDANCHIPLIIRSPRHFPPNSIDSRFADLCDLLPTLLDMADIPFTDPHMMGASLLPNSVRPETRRRDLQWLSIGAGSQRWIAARDVRWKYVHHANGGVEWLFDLEADPHENIELISAGCAPAAVIDSLRTYCREMETLHGPPDAIAPDGSLVTYPYQSTLPEGPNAGVKFPRWCYQHIPCGTESPARETEIFHSEIERATARLGGCTFVRNLYWPPTLKEVFTTAYEHFGASRADLWQFSIDE